MKKKLYAQVYQEGSEGNSFYAIISNESFDHEYDIGLVDGWYINSPRRKTIGAVKRMVGFFAKKLGKKIEWNDGVCIR